MHLYLSREYLSLSLTQGDMTQFYLRESGSKPNGQPIQRPSYVFISLNPQSLDLQIIFYGSALVNSLHSMQFIYSDEV